MAVVWERELWECGRVWENDRQPPCHPYSIEWAKVLRAPVDPYNGTVTWFLSLLALLSMTLILTNPPPSIFEDGQLRPGIYKIQNIYTETFLDIEVHSRDVCCRPPESLGEGRGIVSHCSSS